MLYANFGIRTIDLSDYAAFCTGAAIEYAGAVKDNASSVPNVTDLTYTYYTDSTGTAKTTEADNGAAFEGGAPAKAGTYYVQAMAAEDTVNKIAAAESNLAKMIVTNATVASINPVEDVEVEFGTSEAAIYVWCLASRTTIVDSSGREHTVDLDWTIDGYNENIAGVYMATGTFTLPETVVQSTPPIALEVTAGITVWPAVNAAISPATVVFELDNPGDVETFIDWGSAGDVTDVVHGSSPLVKDYDWEEAERWEEDGFWSSRIIISGGYLSRLDMEAGDTVEFEIFLDIGDRAVLKVEAVENYTLGSNASLSNLRVNNITVADFVYGKFDYEIKLPYGTLPYSPAATVSATSADSKATVEIEQAYELPGITTVKVTAEDGITTQTYTITLTVAASPEYALTITAGSGGNIALGSNGTYEEGAVIDIAAAPASGYRFNKWTSTGGGTFADSNSASTTFTMPANAATITATFTYQGSGGPGGNTLIQIPVHKAVVSGTGITRTTLIVTVDEEARKASADMGTSAGEIFAGGASTVIMPSIPGVEAYELGVPADSLSGSQGEGKLVFSTGKGSVIIPANMLSGVPGINGRIAGIIIGQGDKSGLPEKVKTAIGDRPLVQLTLTLDEVQADWNNPDASVTVSIPYTPTEDELEDPEHIVVWYIDGNGNAVSVPSGRYDASTGTVTFATTHFSHYAVAYVTRVFDDLDNVAWAKKQIEVLAAKGIMDGKATGEFEPQAAITRAEYVSALVRVLGVNATPEGRFDDVEEGSKYCNEISIAKKLGITNGVGNNEFEPDAAITRQDMLVMTERALRSLSKLNETGALADLDRFTDKAEVRDYAIASIAALVSEGLVEGSNNKLNVGAPATRAEAAVFLYRIYSRD